MKALALTLMMTLVTPTMTTTSRSEAKQSPCVIHDSGLGLWVPCGSTMTFKGWVDAGVET